MTGAREGLYSGVFRRTIEGEREMTNLPVVSSELRTVGYDCDNKILEIEFNNGGVYRYFGLPLNEYSGLMTAPSKGRYFNQRIRKKYECVRIGSADP